MNKSRTLILSPHIDDEVLGCYTFLDQYAFVLYFGVENREHISAETRIRELKAAANTLKFKWEIKDFEVNKFKSTDLIRTIESYINSLQPDTILVPFPSYNQDHRAVYDAAMVALRPHDKNFFVNKILVYEQAHVLLWPYKTFEPNYFVELSIQDKVEAYKLYSSQVRAHRSPAILKTIAELRGAQSGNKYAEAFMVKRQVIAK